MRPPAPLAGLFVAKGITTEQTSANPLGLVDLPGLCELFGMSRSSAERLIKRDPSFPKPFKIAGRRYVRLQDLQKYVAQKPEFVA